MHYSSKLVLLAATAITITSTLVSKPALAEGVVNIRNCSGQDLFLSYCNKEDDCDKNFFKLPSNQYITGYRCKITKSTKITSVDKYCTICYRENPDAIHYICSQKQVGYEKKTRTGKIKIKYKRLTLSLYKDPKDEYNAISIGVADGGHQCKMKKRVCKRGRCRKQTLLTMCDSEECQHVKSLPMD